MADEKAEKKQPVYLALDQVPAPDPCPVCGKNATGSGLLYLEPPPNPGVRDNRKPVDQVFYHAGGGECTRRRGTLA
jgi:hypothetical protein